MKFFAAIAVLVASAGVSAQDGKCDAEYIVTRCLQSENAKVAACNQTDFTCLCAAYQAVATCYNNCPKDVRAPSAQVQVEAYCRYASVSATTAGTAAAGTASATSAAANSAAANSASATSAVATNARAATTTAAAGSASASATRSAGVAPRAAAAAAGAGGVAVVAGIAGAMALL